MQGELVRGKTTKIAEVHKKESVRQEKLAKATMELAAAEAVLANLPDYKSPQQEMVSKSLYKLEPACCCPRFCKMSYMGLDI